ncbi:hypothetical protein KDU71_16645 [Carboxylicivirga sediminis]|uniref:GLPGLI family protein n=1 Tax=Carboxylicivirga sediminis TaxID=2006564 RepID=A0A941F5J2_9BACT|nr:hypothetical protein [Carboxylicivirga sediminis]MBR8537201.1 hypothetical protein [Carboxylicivirga sediminis]
MKAKSFITLTMVFQSLCVLSQVNDASTNHLFAFNMDYARLGTVFNDMPLDNINGSPFLNEEFKNGFIQTRSDSIISLVLRYNVYNDAIEFKINDEIYAIKNNESLKMVTIEERVFMYKEFIKSNGTKHNGYLELLSHGKNELYCRYRIRYYPRVPEEAYKEAIEPEFKMQSLSFFYADSFTTPIEFSTKKQLSSLMDEKTQESIHKISRNRAIKYWNKEDLTNLFTTLNK